MDIDRDRLHAVLAPDIQSSAPALDQALFRGEAHAQEYAAAAMESALGKESGIRIIPPHAGLGRRYETIREKRLDSPITQDEADWLRKNTGADALLRFDISDYGLTPKAWRKGYISFEVASTLAIGAIIAYSGSTAAKAAAGAYIAQETAEETAEAYAGFRALDVVSRPVRIEARLIQLNPLATIWNDSDTGLSDVSLSRLTRKVAAAERNEQLNRSTDDAVRDVVSNLSAAIGKLQSCPACRQSE